MKSILPRKALIIASSTLVIASALSAASTANAGIIETAPIVVNEGEQYAFDINGDKKPDFVIVVGPNFNEPTNNENAGEPSDQDGVNIQVSFPGTAEIQSLGERGRIFTQDDSRFDDGIVVTTFKAGESVGESSGDRSTEGALYETLFEHSADDLERIAPEPTVIGPLADEGDSIFVGLSIQTFNKVPDKVVDGEIIGGGPEEQIFNYGWVELLRGSVSILRTGYETTPNLAIVIPGGPTEISEPATLGLLSLAAAGLFGLRRRKAV